MLGCLIGGLRLGVRIVRLGCWFLGRCRVILRKTFFFSDGVVGDVYLSFGALVSEKLCCGRMREWEWFAQDR